MSRKRTVPAHVAAAAPIRPSGSRKGVPKVASAKSGEISARTAAAVSVEAKHPRRAAMLVGYARVSTQAQTTRGQIDGLRAVGCAKVYEDAGVSGDLTTRDGLDACLYDLDAGDTLVVARLDRLGRSLPHLVSTVHDLAKRGVGFRSLAGAIDTTTATGRLVLSIFESLAAFERDLISERTTAALAAKKRRGESVGRRPALTPAQVREARALLAAGRGPSYVARTFRVGRSTLYRHLGGAS
jgi:DNA invertase Pin-like site-specific DNA recombinase